MGSDAAAGGARGFGAQLLWEDGLRPPYPLSKVITTLGRNEANDILLDDPKVSSFHGNILGREDGYHLLDLKSRNGTFVNGNRVNACPLKDGDIIAFGDIRLRFASRTALSHAPMPLARLGARIQTMAVQSPLLRKEAEEMLREVERQQDFLRDLVESASALAESRTPGQLADRLAVILARKLECQAVTITPEHPLPEGGGAPGEGPAPGSAQASSSRGTAAIGQGGAAPGDAPGGRPPWFEALVAEAKSAANGSGRYLEAAQPGAGRMRLAFDAGPGTGWVALQADGIEAAPRDEVRDLLDVLLLFAAVLWRNLAEIGRLNRAETGRLLEAQERESRSRIEGLERKNRELDDFVTQMQSRLVFAEGGPMEKVQALARKLASVDLPVLITGETGTGKTYIAQGIHHQSARARKPFVVIDCATLPGNLIESELFGHEKGAFTGAMGRKAGKVEACAGGTLFLDEIGDLPLELQGKLLRFVQEGRFERLGGNETVHVDARIIAATHYDLAERVRAGKFREDLYYRLHVLPLVMPALRERPGDIPALARHFIRKHFGTAPWEFSPDALAAIRAHAWPGNVRELENKLQRAWLFHSGNVLTAADLGLENARTGVPEPAPAGDDGTPPKTLEEAREEYEGALLRQCLRHFKGNITKCAEHLQISRNTCKSMLRKYRLVQDDGED